MSVEIAGPLDDEFRWVLRLSEVRDDADAPALTEAVGDIAGRDGGATQLWVPAVDDAADAIATDAGFEAYRDLWQLRAPLPVPGSPTDLAVRPFDPDHDADDFLAVNRRAFAWHPEQGRLDRAGLDRLMDEPWFDADGFLLHHAEGRLAGFCWTKVHHDLQPPVGEIFVIAVDPDFHGRGLGGPMTRAGLDHLAAAGLDTAMLYVEADNDAANAVYRRLGFVRHQTDRAYRVDL